MSNRTRSRDAHGEIAGREMEVLDALKIPWRKACSPTGSIKMRCPFPGHEDKNPSWRWDTKTAHWHCTCGNGSVFDAVIRMGQASDWKSSLSWVRKALKLAEEVELEVRFAVGAGASPVEPPAGQEPEPEQAAHALADRPPTPAQVTHFKLGGPSRIDCYMVGSQVYEARCRYETDDGKAVLPWHYDGKRWVLGAAPQPRPPYRLGELQITPDVPILVVEGEKAVDGATERFLDYVATTTSGGCKQAHHTDFAVFAGRKVVVWPDNDEPGRKYAETVCELALRAGAVSTHIVDVPAAWPKGWDLADELPELAAGFPCSLATLRVMLEHAVAWVSPAEKPSEGPGNADAGTSSDDDPGPGNSSHQSSWGTPEPLTDAAAQTPYPMPMLPRGIREAVEEVVAFVQCPPSMAACSALACLSLATQGCADVYRDDTLCGPTSLYFLTVAKSGERKGQTDKHFGEGVKRYQSEQTEAVMPKKREYQAAQANWDAIRKGIEQAILAATKNSKGTADLEKQRLDHEATQPVAPRMPRLIYEDVTSEELAYQLSKGWPSAGIMSSEGGVVFGGHSMQAENVTRYLSLLNGLWSGEQHVHSRRTTESFVVKDARLTVHIAVQEEVLRHFFEGTGGLARGTGFLARCLIAYPESTIGTRVYKEPPSGWPKLSQFTRKTQELLRDAPKPEPKSGQIAFAKLRLSLDAKAAWAAYANATERRQANGGDLEHFTDSGSKAADIVARMAALFHLYETGISGWIERKHIEWATHIVDWHLEQAMHLLARVSLTPQRKNVIELDRWILERCDRTGADHVMAGSILQNGPYGVREKAARDAALDELISMNRVRRGTRDGRKVVEVNPELLHEN